MTSLSASSLPEPSGTLEVLEVLPEEVTLVTTKGHHLFDPRVLMPLDKSPGSVYRLIKEFGWNHSAIELERAEVEGSTYLLVADGKQRIRSLIEINEERIAQGLAPIKARAFISNGSSQGQFLRMWVANHGAKANTPMVEAMMIQNLVRLTMEEALKGAPEDEVARKAVALEARRKAEHQAAVVLGCSIDSVKNRMKLNDASPKVKKALEAGTIAQSDALQIVGTAKVARDAEEQDKLLAKTAPKTPGKRRTKKGKERAEAAAGKGVRGGNKRPTARQVQKIMDAIGEGHDHYKVWACASGVLSMDAYFKAIKTPMPGARVVGKAKPAAKAKGK